MTTRDLTPLRVVPIRRSAGVSPSVVRIYKPFFLAGIISVLTAGCSLGAVALFGVAVKANYTSDLWTPYILAHANSQLYGWVGFFIIGFALQQHAPSPSKVRLFHALAYSSLILMAVGIGLRFAAEPLAQSDPGVWVPIGIFSCVLQLVAVLLFVSNTQLTRHRTGEKLNWQGRFVLLSLAWMIVIAVAEPFYFANAHQADPMQGIFFVAEYFPPYRDAQFLGFVSLMIFGVSFSKLHSCFGVRVPHQRLAINALWIWNLGLVCRMVGWVEAFRAGMTPGSERLYVAGGVLLAVAAFMLVLANRVFEGFAERLAAHKFIRGAFAWLLIAGVLMILEPIHLRLIGRPFSHAYLGAIRHALTVGFISQMILGVGMHVISRMNDIPDTAQKSLWSVFVLVNVGNAGRVALEIATDYTPHSFMPMGFTGFIELAGIAIWAWVVVRIFVIGRKSAIRLAQVSSAR